MLLKNLKIAFYSILNSLHLMQTEKFERKLRGYLFDGKVTFNGIGVERELYEPFLKSAPTLASGYSLCKSKSVLSFKHSGHIGDIIYSIPTILGIMRSRNVQKIDLYIALNVPSGYENTKAHPNGKFRISESSYSALKPLLEKQQWCRSVNVFENQRVDYDLDIFRDHIKHFDRGSLVNCLQLIFPVAIKSEEPWLDCKKNNAYSESIVIARSSRYAVPFIDYSFLNKYKSVKFLGLESEYSSMKEVIPNLEWVRTDNFYDLAVVIKSSKLFIGNQSSPFSVAEALKVPRLLECCLSIPNVVPVGGRCSMFCEQTRFEKLVHEFYNEKYF